MFFRGLNSGKIHQFIFYVTSRLADGGEDPGKDPEKCNKLYLMMRLYFGSFSSIEFISYFQ